ncbi:MAG TPA: rod shape-determining protein MreC [Pyrinomonadaceae bacterium]|jgi:rod shape-determining protein MreC
MSRKQLLLTHHASLITVFMAVNRTQKEIRQRAPWWLVGLLFGNLALMSYDARDDVTKQRLIRVWAQAVASPFQRATSGAGGAGVSFFQKIASWRTAVAENEQLKQRVAQLETEVRQARIDHVETERLRAMLDLKEKSEYQLIPAAVIARDPSLWFNTVTINRGSSSGVGLNMPVVMPGGIVGRVVATSPWTAQVMLITDDKSAAGAAVGQLGESSALGSVRGLGENGLLEMRYVSGLAEVKVGDFVVTTGQDGIYPQGLNVGTVVEVKSGSATTPHTIHIKPGARIDSLEELAVLQYRPPQRPAPDQTLPNVDKGRKQ